jgi:transposase
MSKEEIQAKADRAEARARGETAKEFIGDSLEEGKDKAEVERLAGLSRFKYDQEREAAAEKLGVRISTLDEAVRRQRRKSAKAAKQQIPELDQDQLKRSAAHIIQHASILDLFGAELHKVVAGETANGKLLYLVGTSRLFDKPMNAAIKGTSAGGKSEIRKRVLGFFPPEDVVTFTSLSEKALIYYDGDFAHKILSMGEATATDEQSFQDYLLRELMSEGCIRHKAPQKIGNDIITTTIEKQGPVAFLVTTTKNKMHPENETRMLSLEIDDSEGQTQKVLDKVAHVDGLHDAAQVDYGPWQDFQRWLALGECRTVVPFAKAMVELIPPVAVRLRRDVGQVICAIKVHALLHRDQRDQDGVGRIIADIDHDYTAIRELMNSILAEGSGVAVNRAMAETIEAVTVATASMTEAEGASAQDIARDLKLDKSAARRRLLSARDEGFVVNLEQRRGMPGKYRVTSQQVEARNILPDAATLADSFRSTRFAHVTSESVPPCHREEKAEAVLLDDGGKPGGKPVVGGNDGGSGWQPVANGLATDKSQNGNEKSSPVARWQGFSGGYGEEKHDDLSIPGLLDRRDEICAHCGQPWGGEPWDYDGVKVRLHPRCEEAWVDAYRASQNGAAAVMASSA